MNFDILFRTSAVYLFIILAIRLFGKKELAQLSIVDFVFILLISNAVQNAMVGPDTSLTGGLMAASSLFLINFVLKKLMYYFKPVGKILQGEPILLVYKGKIKYENLKHADISLDELNAVIREHGVEDIEKVDLAILEVDGNISILSDNFRNQAIKKRRTRTFYKSEE